MLTITLDGPPIPKLRHRFSNQGNFFRTYDPQEKIKQSIKNYIVAKVEEAKLSENKEIAFKASHLLSGNAFHVVLIFDLPIAKSNNLWQINAKLWHLEKHNQKPDIDNLIKFYLDCARGILFPDDKMIMSLIASKNFSSKPKTIIQVMPITDLNLHESVKKIITVFEPEQFKEFLIDVKKFNNITFQDLETLDKSNQEKWLMASASILAEFLEKYGDILKKASKYKNF